MSFLTKILSLGLILCVFAYAPSHAAAAADEAWDRGQLDFFEARIRPVLAEHCYRCHSARADKLKGGLRLDSRAGLLKGGDSGTAVLPGDAAKSRLIEAVRYGDQETAMPPAGKLPEAVVKDLEIWVGMGAPWPPEVATPAGGEKRGPDFDKLRREHWAYQPRRAVEIPQVRDKAWARGDIDRFVLARLESQGLKPVADADRVTLVRRVYFDLIGLPPTPEQIDAFVNDTALDAYKKLVDGLLASPHFGERWGRHWLDVARYAESVTLRGLVLKDAWRYRDYVIDSFNRDRPFDRFMQEQIAGDLMPAGCVAERRRQMTGTTFLALGNTNLEEQDKRQLRMDVVDEQLDTIGKAFLGQTLGCARCHDHKFDPIPAADYYAMAGILRSTKAMEHANVSRWLEVPLPEEPAVEEQIVRRERALAETKVKLDDARAALAKLTVRNGDVLPKGVKASVVKVSDLPGIVVDDEAAKKVGAWSHSTAIATYIGDGYVHDADGGKGERSLTFQPELPKAGRYEVRLSYMSGKARAPNVPVMILSEDGENSVIVDQKKPPLIGGRFVSLGTYAFAAGGQGYVLVSNEGTSGIVVADAVQFLPVDAATSDDPTVAATGETSPETQALADEARRLEAELKRLTASGPVRQTIVSVLEEKEVGDTQIHVRGVVHNLGATVPRGFLSCVKVSSPPRVPRDQSGRLQLGQWLAHRDNPLPARVMANRAWHWLTGQGIVRTVDNFGTTGESPSHPELLEHLAGRFVDDGWSVKRLVREIVLSRSYQLSTMSDAAALAHDPENRLHWRANRRRLEAECIRDAMLAASGRLDVTPGGPGFQSNMSADYGFKHKGTRRSVYEPVFRNALLEVFQAFDFADPSMVVGARNISTVAPQALFLLNNPFPREQAEATAERLLADASLTDDAARLARACRLTLGRDPTPGERDVLMQFFAGSHHATPAGRREAWAQVVRALFASTDFRYLN